MQGGYDLRQITNVTVSTRNEDRLCFLFACVRARAMSAWQIFPTARYDTSPSLFRTTIPHHHTPSLRTNTHARAQLVVFVEFGKNIKTIKLKVMQGKSSPWWVQRPSLRTRTLAQRLIATSDLRAK